MLRLMRIALLIAAPLTASAADLAETPTTIYLSAMDNVDPTAAAVFRDMIPPFLRKCGRMPTPDDFRRLVTVAPDYGFAQSARSLSLDGSLWGETMRLRYNTAVSTFPCPRTTTPVTSHAP